MGLKLKIDSGYSSDLMVIAISSLLRDYRISFFINNILPLRLKKYYDVLGNHEDTEFNTCFSFYFYNDSDNLTEYYLVSLKDVENFVVNSLKNADYLFIIKSSVLRVKPELYIKSLMKIKNVQLAFNVDVKKIKNFDLLLSSFELCIEDCKREL